ncbi:MAG: hypothetical protein ABI840_06240 [bacterium]
MEKEKILTKLKEQKEYLSDKFFVDSIGIFGSYKKNTFDDSSHKKF